ncbi:MAG TPA: hypothetical protein VMY59_07905 [Candidatus Thermoplasmatota archaeon]|nr:hypothetical protein [Candidatus Thermoplasmatota archaeon]
METFSSEKKQHLIERIEQRIAQGQMAPVHTLGGRSYTTDQLIDEIKRGTPAGDDLLYQEKKLEDELNRLRQRG